MTYGAAPRHIKIGFSGMVGKRSDVDVIERETLYQGHLKVHRYRFRHKLFAGGWSGELTREVMERAHAVAVLPYDPKHDTVVLIEQFRPGIFVGGHDPWSIECVAGLIEEDESLEEVARRETNEEAGLEILDFRNIQLMYASPGVFSEHVSIFVARVDATNAGGIHGLDHENEDIRVFSCPFGEALGMLDNGRIVVSHTVVALQWLALHRDEMRECWA
jgi:ADP-ribose pyrophosphatase